MTVNDPTAPEPVPTQATEVERTHMPQYNDLVKSKCQCSYCTDPNALPMPMVLWCPSCGSQHIDEGEWAVRKHKTHRCVDRTEVIEERDAEGNVVSSASTLHHGCGFEWTPSLIHTVGVRNIE